MAKPATGTLIWRPTGWYGRFWTVVDGERVRVCRALGTSDKALARREMDRLMTIEMSGNALPAASRSERLTMHFSSEELAHLHLAATGMAFGALSEVEERLVADWGRRTLIAAAKAKHALLGLELAPNDLATIAAIFARVNSEDAGAG